MERNPDQTSRNPLVVELKSNNESLFFNKISKNFYVTARNFSLFNSILHGLFDQRILHWKEAPVYLTPTLKVMKTTNLACDWCLQNLF